MNGEGEEARTEAGEEALPPCMSSGGVDLAQREGLIGFLVLEWMKIFFLIKRVDEDLASQQFTPM